MENIYGNTDFLQISKKNYSWTQKMHYLSFILYYTFYTRNEYQVYFLGVKAAAA